MTDANATKLPVTRWIENTENADWVTLDEAYAEEIHQAISLGKQIAVDSVMTGYIFAEARKESCLTRFTDPRTSEVRWAVEVWAGQRKWARDFRSIDGASDWREHMNDYLGI